MRFRWLPIFIIVLAQIPLLLPNAAIHIDEISHWVPRTEIFLTAMQTGNYADTVVTEHPGVTTMALGALGQLVIRAIDPDNTLSLMTRLQILRFPVTLVNALVVIAGYLVMLKLFAFDTRLAFIAALLWALDPYLRWYSHLLHIDGMSTSLMALSFLMMLVGLRYDTKRSESAPLPLSTQWRWLVFAAIIGGFAGLTRFTSFFLVGVVGLLALMNWIIYRKAVTIPVFMKHIVLPVILFTSVMIITWVAFYPGMWTNAQGVYTETISGFDNAGSPHENGNFFMGHEVDDPGAIFYPIALAIRITPLVMIALLLAFISVFMVGWNGQRHLLLALLFYVLCYGAALTLQAKKFDRYIIPVFPILNILAAFGLVWFATYLNRWRVWHKPIQQTVWVAFTLFVAGYSLWFYPNDYAHSNSLVGGGQTAGQVLLVGAGEGMPEIAQTIEAVSGIEDACFQYVYTRYGDILTLYIPCAYIVRLGDINLDKIGNAYYLVRYISHKQRHPDINDVLDNVVPVRSVDIHGITYADIYDAEDVKTYLRNLMPENDS